MILINVQYLQSVVFSFKKGLNGQYQYHSSSGSHHLIKKIPVKFPIPSCYFENPEYRPLGYSMSNFLEVQIVSFYTYVLFPLCQEYKKPLIVITFLLYYSSFVGSMLLFFNCYFAALQPTLCHYQGGSLTNTVLITAF